MPSAFASPARQFYLHGVPDLQNNRMSLKGDKRPKPKPKPSRKLPDDAICRAQRHAVSLFSCLVDSPQRCEYVLVIGKNLFCSHPNCEKIAARTKLS
jgi:hypothetical protein